VLCIQIYKIFSQLFDSTNFRTFIQSINSKKPDSVEATRLLL
jgi:hypothetical protein